MSSWECRVSTKAPIVQRTSRAPKRQSNMTLVHPRYSQSFANDRCKRDRCYCWITKMCWTSRRRSVSFQPGKNRGRSRVAKKKKNSKSLHVQIFGHVFHDTKTQWRERHVEEVLVWLGREKVQNWECLWFIGSKDYSCRFSWMTSKWMEESRIWLRCGIKLMELVDLSRRTSTISWSWIFGMHSTWM